MPFHPPRPPRRPRRAWMIVVTLAASTAALAQATTRPLPPAGIAVGPAVIAPSLTTGYSYDSNIFLRDEEFDPQGESVLNIQPAVVFYLPFSNSSFRFTDSLQWRDYSETEQENGRASNDAAAELDLNFASFDSLQIAARHVNGVADTIVFDPGGETVFAGQSFRTHDFSIGAAREVPGHAGYRVEVGREALRFDPDPEVNFFNYRGFYGAAAYLQPLSPSITLSIGYEGGRYDHFTADDPSLAGEPFRTEREDTALVGVEGRIASGRAYQVFVGWERLDFEGNDAPDFDGVIVRASAAVVSARTTTWLVGADRRPYRSFFYENNFYVYEAVRTELVQRFLRSSTFGMTCTLARQSYKDPVPPTFPQAGTLRVDRTLWLEAYANLAIRDRLAFRIAYRKNRRASNLDNEDFDQNVFFGGFVIGWL